jgi:hypothetical protein
LQSVVWLVSYAEDDDREMTSQDIQRALGAGEITMETIVWRDGMPEWQAIAEIPSLRQELERLAGPRADKRRTVMGGFQAGAAKAGPPLPGPNASTAAQPNLSHPPGGSSLRAPHPNQQLSPQAVAVQHRSTLLGTGGQPAFGITGAQPLVGGGAVGHGALGRGAGALSASAHGASAHGASAHGASAHGASAHGANGPSARGLSHAMPSPKVADLDRSSGSPLNAGYRDERQAKPQPLPDPADDGPESWDQEPTISLHHDSVVSLPPEALESVVAFLPPMDSPSAPRGIFQIDSNPPEPQIVIQNAPAGRKVQERRTRTSERASESILNEPSLPAPQIQVVSPMHAPVRAPQAPHAPHAPHPPRPMGRETPVSPVPAAPVPLVQPLGSLPPHAALGDDTFVTPRPKRGGFGKVVAAILLLAGLGAGMFYMGRQSAGPAPTTLGEKGAKPAVETPAANSNAAEVTAKAEPESTSKSAAAAAAPNPEPATGSKDETPGAAAATPPAGGKPRGNWASRPAPEAPTGGTKPPETEKPAIDPRPPSPPASDAPFDTAAASAALTKAASAASSCRQGSDPSGVAAVTVTFANSGRAINANVSGPPFAGTVTGGCIASKMRQASVPPFGGDRITVRKQVVIQ